MKYLLVIDMQNDFISQALGTPEALGIVEPVCRLIRGFDGDVIYTRDTHRENYLETQEGGKTAGTALYRRDCRLADLRRSRRVHESGSCGRR